MSVTAISPQQVPFSAIVELIHRLGKEVVAPAAEDVDREARFPVEAFDAFKENKLLSAYVSQELGGMGLSMTEVCKICELLGRYCASTAMVYAMHQIQVACIAHHCGESEYFQNFLRELVEKQYLLASATTELGVGGDLRSSKCAVSISGDSFTLDKQAPVISYAVAADAIMVTCRRSEDAAPSDQVQVLVLKENCQLEQLSGWDTLGFRGTCSSGFSVKSTGNAQQVQPEPFADILAQTMHPVSHLVWGSLWLGLAVSAVNIARDAVRGQARKTPGETPLSAIRLTETDEKLFSMRAGLYGAIDEYQQKIDQQAKDFVDFGFSIRTNNVKIRCSELVVEIVSNALFIVGISAYKNDSSNSLSRHLRDSYGAALMVNNDRIRNHNATMQIAYREK